MKQFHRATLVVNILSIAIPIAVAALLGIRTKIPLGDWTKALPHGIAGINTITALLLVVGWIAQKVGNIRVHRFAMTSAICLGASFLLCYVTYHLSNPSTAFQGQGAIRIVYYSILISHIGFSLIVLPLVLRAFLFAWTDQIANHRRIARIAFPIWLYVSVSGVIVYWMISPYYATGQ
jgi:putative membrane protein